MGLGVPPRIGEAHVRIDAVKINFSTIHQFPSEGALEWRPLSCHDGLAVSINDIYRITLPTLVVFFSVT